MESLPTSQHTSPHTDAGDLHESLSTISETFFPQSNEQLDTPQVYRIFSCFGHYLH